MGFSICGVGRGGSNSERESGESEFPNLKMFLLKPQPHLRSVGAFHFSDLNFIQLTREQLLVGR